MMVRHSFFLIDHVILGENHGKKMGYDIAGTIGPVRGESEDPSPLLGRVY
jgi:hypothetical protein